VREVEPDFERLDEVLTRARRAFGDAVWGVPGAVVGLASVVIGWIAIVALIVGVARGLGLDVSSTAVRYAGIGASQAFLIAVALTVALRSGAGLEALGVRTASLRTLVEGLGLGVLVFLLANGYRLLLLAISPEAHARMIEEIEQQMGSLQAPRLILLFFAVVVAPLAEELFFRGLLFAGLRHTLGPATATTLSALAFAVIHVMWWSLVPLMIVGVAAALVYERHRSLAAPLCLHASFNLISLTAQWLLAA
jgi:hypothetical protein